jgi:hypothetical protein
MGSRAKKERLRKGRLFVPLIFSFGATLVDMPLDDFLEDPTKISNTMRLIQSHFQSDGAVCYADCTVLARSLGCSAAMGEYPPAVEPLAEWPGDFDQRIQALPQTGGIATALEVTHRLNVLLPDAILVAMVPGPLKLLTQLTGDSGEGLLQQTERLAVAARAGLTFAKALGEAGIDILVVMEDNILSRADQGAKVLSRCYTPIWNTAKFYDVVPLLMLKDFLPDDATRLGRIIDGVIVPIDVLDAAKRGKRLSVSLPVSLLEQEPVQIEAVLAGAKILEDLESAKLFLVTTQGEVPVNINKEFMIRGIQTIRDVLGRHG